MTEIASFRDFMSGHMRPACAVQTLSNSERLFPTARVARGGAVRELPPRREPFAQLKFEDQGRTFDLNDYLSTNRIAGLLVLKGDRIALENYELGLLPETRWASCSLAKSVT